MRIFIIGGKGSNGKNTIAEFIKEYYNLKQEKTVIIGFSDYIKLLATKISDWDGKEDSKPRKLLQDIGQDIRTNIDEDYFLKRIKEDISFYQTIATNIVIADARLPHEIEHIKEHFNNVLAIKVIRDIDNNKMTIDEKNHLTETALDNYNNFDYKIINTELNKLKNDIFEILERVK